MASSSHRSIPTVDRISDLPDSILCHVLSFLPSKQAATTSILSKRWKSVWLSVLSLHFDYQTFRYFTSFREFVYSTMFKLRDKKTPIHSFTFKLGYSSRFDQKDFNRIFKFVMERGVQNLNFNMFDKTRLIKLPQRVFNLKMLQVLKLTNLNMTDFDPVDFPRLKTLHLQRIYFISHEYFVKFLFGCPILEDLHTEELFTNKSRPEELFTNKSRQSLVPQGNFNALPNLVKVRIVNDMNTPMNLVCKTKILHVEKMSISSKTLHLFHNLTHLELSVHDMYTCKCDEECTLLIGILPHFPKLQHFTIQNCGEIFCYNCLKQLFTTPECISSQLKTRCIRGYTGKKHEFEFAKYIMQHSKVLETMIVKSTTYVSKDQMMLELFSCTTGTTRCKLLFD